LTRRKVILIALIALAVTGGALNAITDGQIARGVPVTNDYLDLTNCVQTILWVLFSLIGGFTLTFDPDPLAKLLEKIPIKKANSKIGVRLLGIFMLVTLPLNAFSLTHNCKVLFRLFSVDG